MRTRFILIETSHAGNVGAAARAMKTMGFDDLVLVRPRWANVLRREETIQRASGALDVLQRCRIVDSLEAALDGVTHLCATAMTARDFGPSTHTPRAHFESLLNREQTNESARGLGAILSSKTMRPGGVGFLFGSERFGMRNDDVYRCHVCLRIPTHPQFGSLNLAAAVQVIAYEWRQALGGFEEPLDAPGWVEQRCPAADARQVAGLLQHWEQALVTLDFLNPATPKKLMPRLNALLNRAAVTEQEVHILRGIAKSVLELHAQPRAAKRDQAARE